MKPFIPEIGKRYKIRFDFTNFDAIPDDQDYINDPEDIYTIWDGGIITVRKVFDGYIRCKEEMELIIFFNELFPIVSEKPFTDEEYKEIFV